MLTVTQSPSVVLLPNQAAAPQLSSKKDIRLEVGDFIARLALTEEERMAAYRLRFLVFNLEMNEGLESAFADGYDKDHFDDVCDT
jgi:putative hemolysin